MSARVPFTTVLAVLEEHGWDFVRIKRPFRVFVKPGRPIVLIQVEDNSVDADEVQRIKEFLQKDQGNDA